MNDKITINSDDNWLYENTDHLNFFDSFYGIYQS